MLVRGAVIWDVGEITAASSAQDMCLGVCGFRLLGFLSFLDLSAWTPVSLTLGRLPAPCRGTCVCGGARF